MKELFVNPEIEVINFRNCEITTLSTPEETTGEWSGDII